MLHLLTHHPNTFEFIPGISLTRFPDGKLLMLTFGTYTLEIYFDLKENNNQQQSNGNQSFSSSASC